MLGERVPKSIGVLLTADSPHIGVRNRGDAIENILLGTRARARMPARMMPSTISLGMWLIFIAAVATKAKVTIPVNTPLAHTINLLIISFLSSGESSQSVDRLARRFVTDSRSPCMYNGSHAVRLAR